MNEGECKSFFYCIICSVLFFITHGQQNFPYGIIQLSCNGLEVVVPSFIISHD